MDVLEALECLYLLTQFLASIQNKKRFIFNEFFSDAWSGKDSQRERLRDGWVLEKPKAGRINVCKSVFPRELSKENSCHSNNTVPFRFYIAVSSLENTIETNCLLWMYCICIFWSVNFWSIAFKSANSLSVCDHGCLSACSLKLNYRIYIRLWMWEVSHSRNWIKCNWPQAGNITVVIKSD